VQPLEGRLDLSTPTTSSSRFVARLLLVTIMCSASSLIAQHPAEGGVDLGVRVPARFRYAVDPAVDCAEEPVPDVHPGAGFEQTLLDGVEDAEQHGDLDGARGVEPPVAVQAPRGPCSKSWIATATACARLLRCRIVSRSVASCIIPRNMSVTRHGQC
jgi:hypothetical protein